MILFSVQGKIESLKKLVIMNSELIKNLLEKPAIKLYFSFGQGRSSLPNLSICQGVLNQLLVSLFSISKNLGNPKFQKSSDSEIEKLLLAYLSPDKGIPLIIGKYKFAINRYEQDFKPIFENTLEFGFFLWMNIYLRWIEYVAFMM